MKYQNKNFQKFYNETVNKIFDIESWYSFTDVQRDEIIRSHKRLVSKSKYLHFIGLNLTNSFSVDETDWINMIKEEYKPNYALIRSKRLNKIGI